MTGGRRYDRIGLITVLALSTAVARAGAPEATPFVQRIPGTEVSFEMLPVPGGMFRMGSRSTEQERKADEGPQVEVDVEPFHMGRCEVTWPEYDAFSSNYHRLAGMDSRLR